MLLWESTCNASIFGTSQHDCRLHILQAKGTTPQHSIQVVLAFYPCATLCMHSWCALLHRVSGSILVKLIAHIIFHLDNHLFIWIWLWDGLPESKIGLYKPLLMIVPARLNRRRWYIARQDTRAYHIPRISLTFHVLVLRRPQWTAVSQWHSPCGSKHKW